jgi:hypothetical protein
MAAESKQEKLVEKKVTYTLFKDGRFYIVENVPARVNEETGEQFFSPQTVEHLQRIILSGQQPTRIVQTPVFEFVGR